MSSALVYFLYFLPYVALDLKVVVWDDTLLKRKGSTRFTMPNLLSFSRNVKLSFLTLNLAVFTVLLFLMLSYSENDRFHMFAESADSTPSPSTITVYNAKNKTMELNVMGFLGDQMFVYASVLGLAIANNRQPLIEGASRLRQIFQITYKANNKRRVPDTTGWLIQRNGCIVKNELLILPPTNITLKGRFQSWKYFHHIREKIRREFTFQPEIKEMAKTFYDDLLSRYSSVTVVGIHAYRAKNRLSKYNVMVAPLSYFIKAIKLMTAYVQGGVLFIISSDDPLWCKENFSDQQDLIVLDSGPTAGHLAILASTTYLIISTGSFGWWAAWLADGVTIYYKVEGQGLLERDYFPDTWQGIGA